MQWPDWEAVLARRFKEFFGADLSAKATEAGETGLTSEDRKMLAQDEFHKIGVDNPMLKFDIRTSKFAE
jgi:hypothetical protein